jgi:hypothetical protein
MSIMNYKTSHSNSYFQQILHEVKGIILFQNKTYSKNKINLYEKLQKITVICNTEYFIAIFTIFSLSY